MDRNGENLSIYEFEGFRLDVAKRVVYGMDGEPLPLKAKAFEILLLLVQNPGEVIERDAIMEVVWPDTVVEENNLTQHISSLRRLFGERPDNHRFIATAQGRGYRFVANVRVSANPVSGESESGIGSNSNEAGSGYLHQRFWRSRAVLIGLSGIVLFGLAAMSLYVVRDARETASDKRIQSMAVLPFKPLVPETRNDGIEMGITDTLIRKLTAAEGLSVRPLPAVRRFGSLEQDTVAAGRSLGVEAVLDGYVQIADDRIRVSVQLQRVSDGKYIWTDRFEGPSTDIFRLQDSIAERVATALQIPLGTRVVRDYTQSLEAYQHYMNGRLHTFRLVLPEVTKAISFYEQAIESDPDYTLAYVGLTNAYRSLVLTCDQDPAEIMPKAKAAALKAVELDPNLAEAHIAMGNFYFWYGWEWQSAERHFLSAIALDPKSPTTHLFYAHFLSNTGRHEQAIEEVRKGRDLEPANLLAMAYEGQILMLSGRREEALEVLRRAVDMEPAFWLAHLFLSKLYIEMGNYEEAIKASETAEKISVGNAEAVALTAWALAKSGNRDGALRILAEMEARARSRYVPAYTLAIIYNGLNDKENALKMLELSFKQKDSLMTFLKVEPKWNNIRSEPKFIDLLERMNFE